MHSKRIIDYFTNTSWNDLPNDIQHQAKRCFLDAFGAMVAGMQTPVYEITKAYVESQIGSGPVQIIRSDIGTTTTGATLAYGIAANALDIDDGCRLAKGHPGASVLPATIAAAQSLKKCSGHEFLTAFTFGYEAAIRAAYVRHATHSTYHTSGSWGAVGAAASAAKLMNLDQETYFNALGTASYHAPIAPMMVGIEVPSMGKDSIGWGAFVGVSSVELAKLGFTASNPIFDQTPNDDWMYSIGKTFEIMHVFFKPYSACRWAQAGVDGVLKIMREEGLTVEKIKNIRIITFSEAAALSREYPKNTEEAQYNFSFPIAAAALYGEIGPKQILPPVIFEEELLRMMDKVSVIVKEKYQALFPAQTVANVELEDVDGNCYQSGDLSPRWGLDTVLPTDQELEDKFKWIVKPVVGRDNTDKLVRLIWNLEQCTDVKEIFDLCD